MEFFALPHISLSIQSPVFTATQQHKQLDILASVRL